MACPVCRMDAGAGPPKKMSGRRTKTLAYGHAANAKYAEGPHLYKIKNHYLLLMAEGGSDYNHAVTALTAKSPLGTVCTLYRQSRIDTPPSWQGLPCAVSRTCRSGTDTDREIGMLCFSVNRNCGRRSGAFRTRNLSL